MKIGDFTKKLSTDLNVSHAKADEIFRTVLDNIFDAVESDGSLRTSFGTFTMVNTAPREARKGRNPKTGEEIMIPATPSKKKVAFRMSKNYKEELNG